jgi:hypothetical protein
MTVAANPAIATSGLVFEYDMSNPKSFLGAVGTNQFAIPVPDGSNNVTFAVQGNGTFQRVYSGTYGGYTITNNDVVYKFNMTAVGGCYFHGNTISVSAGQYITLTFDFYISPDVTNYPTLNYLANIEGTNGSSVSDPTPTQIGVWKTASVVSGVTSAGSYNLLLYPGACSSSYLASSGYILYKNPQVLITSASNYSSPFTGPFGARSSTQALFDETGLNKPTVNSLTYNSTGTTFSFNGTSDSITIPFNSSQFTFNSEQTIIIWMKDQSPSSARRNPYNQAYAGAGTITHENDTNLNYYYGTAGNNTTPYTSHTSPFSVVVNETAQIAITRNTSQTAWYKNGALGNTQANPYGASVATGTSDITIGNGYAGYFGGSLYIVQIYNRALTADEIAANYQAYRGRYGI